MSALLKEKAPGVHRALSDMISTAELEQLSTTFAAAYALNLTSEPQLSRTPGADFNPRPARLVHILIKETAERDIEVLGAAMLTCCDPGLLLDPPDQLRSLSASSLRIARSALIDQDAPTGAALQVRLARTLDDVRHLHMRDLSFEGRQELLANLKLEAGKLRPAAGSSKLMTLLDAAINRLARLMGSDEEA